jgi:nitrate/TMAO reductase-like tetraheme cytochrome c subunit
MNASSNDLGREEDLGSVAPGSLETEDAPPAEASAESVEPAGGVKRRSRKRLRKALRTFFLPPEGSRLRRRLLPWVTVLLILVGLAVGGAYGWTWSNSPGFCGKLCHTMPPQYAAYQLSPHSRVSCVECHIGRGFIGQQLARKSVHIELLFRTAFGLYDYPIYAKSMRPAREACETCHAPAKFSNDAMIVKQRYSPDEANTNSSIYLIMHIGGGLQREGLGYGIHWHVENTVQFVSTDSLDQTIPYIRVTKADGTVTEYTDVTANFDASAVKQSDLKTMDCITCHNRVSHSIPYPDESVDSSLARGVISTDIPYIRREAVAALTKEYANEAAAFAGIAQDLDAYYKQSYPDFYASRGQAVEAAIAEVQRIYSVTVFSDQKLDWTSHPDNLGHINSPGCFRCHDGKHLDSTKKAIRLECNLCHSIPVVAGAQQLVTDLEVDRGPEPATHLNANWISLHNLAYNSTCANCHTTGDDGGTSNTSFCSNSACHGTAFTYAGFDAPALRKILAQQLPTSSTVTQQPSQSGVPTWDSFFGSLFFAKCGSCHGTNTPAAELNLTTYASAMAGSINGAVIVAGDSAHSVLVQVQSAEHFANLSGQELQAVKQWIDAGAPEK